MSVGEDEKGLVVSDDLKNLDWLDSHKGGFFLMNKKCSYDIDIIEDLPINVRCFLDVPAPHIQILVSRLAECGPEFGYACSPDEREAKNRAHNKIGVNSIESWVGRNLDQSIPGLYWWTLMPSSLAEKHGIPIEALSSVALEHVEVPGVQKI